MDNEEDRFRFPGTVLLDRFGQSLAGSLGPSLGRFPVSHPGVSKEGEFVQIKAISGIPSTEQSLLVHREHSHTRPT